MNNLTFIRTLTVSEFKAEFENPEIKLLKNPDTQKRFFSVPSVEFNGKQFSGPISEKCDIKGELSFSEVEGEEGRMWILHNPGKGSVEQLATL